MELREIKDLIIKAKESNATMLDLSCQKLTSLPPEISKLENLKTLCMSCNKLISLPPEISKLENLTELEMSENQLTSLPPEISKLKNLTSLNISCNQSTSLPPKILELGLDIKWKYQFLQEGIFLEGNPLENPPIEIVKKGREDVINYFKFLEYGKSNH